MARKAEYSIKRSMPTYSRLRDISWTSMRDARELEEGRQFNLIVAMLFSAFCIEAYLNHVGEISLDYWDVLKKKLSPREKLQVLSKELEFPVDFGSRPFQTFGTIFKFRNLLAHAESEVLVDEGEILLGEGEHPPKPLTEWEQLVTVDIAQRFVDDTEVIVEVIHEHAETEEETPFQSEVIFTETRIPPSSNAEQ